MSLIKKIVEIIKGVVGPRAGASSGSISGDQVRANPATSSTSVPGKQESPGTGRVVYFKQKR